MQLRLRRGKRIWRMPVLASSVGGLGPRLSNLKWLVSGRLKLGLYSTFTRYGLRRDLSKPHENPTAKIPFSVRRMVDTDLHSLLPVDNAHLDASERILIAWRRDFFRKAPQGCYVAVDMRSNTPCYMQWLLGVDQNPLLKEIGGFPALKEEEALLENAFTPVSHRGLGIMSAAMAQIAERASDMNARYVQTFVGDDNIASLKGCQRAGFYPHLLNRRTRMAFGTIRMDTFELLEEKDPRREIKF